jgi:hypothetical protein
MKKYYYLSIATLSVIFITGVSLVFAQSWEAPTETPPGGNAAAPINTSDVSQTKDGFLWAEDLLTFGDVYTDQSILAPNIIESTDNTRILTINPTDGEFEWREAGPWAAPGISAPGGYEIVTGPTENAWVGSTASCSAGNKVIGGGCELVPSDEFTLGYGYPDTDQSYFCVNSIGNQIRAHAICMSGL